MNTVRRAMISPFAFWNGTFSMIPLALFSSLLCLVPPSAGAAPKTPVIFDSDIGDDIDDTWALGLLLRCPELDLRLVVGDQGKQEYRAKLLAKLLQTAGRTDIPVGIGMKSGPSGEGPQAPWVKDYLLHRYPGQVHADGVQAMIDVIMKSDRPVTVIAVGPLPNVAEALTREPRIAERAQFVGMHGSVRLGYGGSKTVSAEYNVRANAKACRAVLSAPWKITITPLDTCGLIVLTGQKYQAVRNASDPVARAIIENYQIWSAPREKNQKDAQVWKNRSSTLFDTVAVYLAVSQEWVTMETLPIRVTDDGYTRIDPTGHSMHVATAWKNMGAFEDFLVRRLAGK